MTNFFPARRAWLLLGALLLPLVSTVNTFASTNLSAWVFPGSSGRMLYPADRLGNRLVDASGAGYKSGLLPLPLSNSVPVRTNVSPVAGDNRVNIQNAINYVQSLPLDANGFRGAVLLNAGEYPLSNSLTISASGVVLRGVGSGTNGTVLRATATNQYTLVKITGSGSASVVNGTTHVITNLYVPVGARSFQVDSTSGLAVNDHVYVRRIATDAWIHDLGMDLLGPPPGVNPWTASGYHIDMDRVIKRIEGIRIFIDAPVTCAIDASYTNGTIRKFTWTSRISNSGIEHLRGVSDYDSGVVDDENHGWIFVQFNSIEHGWARDIISEHFGYSCVALASGSKFVTVADCQCLDPVSQITGGRRYGFVMDDDVLCLVQNCYTRQDRHQFVTQSLTTGPNVFVDGLSDSAKSDAGPHHRWATGNLWDNVTINGQNLDIQNRGNLGSGHGWSGANCIAYNCDADGGYVVQNPPGAHNWLIGSLGNIENGTVYVGPHDPGTYDSQKTNVFPNSLYYAQLQDRLAAPNLMTREYWLGAINGFTNAVGSEAVPVDVTWSNTVQAAAGTSQLDGFDVVTTNHWVPFTFNYSLAVTDRIIGASLTVALRAATSTTNLTLYLDATNNAFSFASLGWLPVGTGTNTTVRVMDLMSQTNLLTDGRLNLAVQGAVGIDWALLQLEVAPTVVGGNISLAPVADATVRGGANAALNFGVATTLTVKEDTSADNDRRAFLRWDLSSVTGVVYSAKIRLTPVSVGTNGVETGVTISTNHVWSESGMTWNNQPAVGKRFVTWIPATNNAPVEFMVTPQVLDALNSDRLLTVELYSLRNVGASGTVDFASREAVDPSARPQLILFTAVSPPAISHTTNRTVAVNGSTGPVPFSVSDAETAAGSLILSAGSSDTNLVPVTNIVFGGSGSNRTVTVTPAANQGGVAVITLTVADAAGLTASDSFTLTVSSHPAGVFVWNGPGAGANNWSTGGNWTPAGPPEGFDDVKFFDAGAGGVAVSNINNVVDASFSGTIASLQFGNTNGNHTMSVSAGKILEISGVNGLIVGTETDNGSAQSVFTTITGKAGAVLMDEPAASLIVRQGSANNSSQRATLDMSGLGSFTATLNRLLVGVAGPVNRPVGTLILARTNAITVFGSAPAIEAADSGSNGGSASFIQLGLENDIFADTVTIGRQKSSATLNFNPAFTNASPSLYLRGVSADRVATFSISDNSAQSVSGSSSSGAVDLSNGTADMMVDVLYVGKGQTSNGSGSATGSLTFDDGLLDVNTLEAGYQNSTAAAAVVSGTVNVKSTAQLLVNSSLRLARYTGSGTASVGALNIFGGTLLGDGDIIAGGGTSSLAISGGTLAVNGVVGTPAAPIGKVALTNALLQFSVISGVTNLVATSLATGGGANAINLTALPPALVPARAVLVDYSGTIGGAGFNFVLGSLGSDGGYLGYLSNNIANSSVDLVFANVPAAPPEFGTVRLSGTNLVFSGTNGLPGWPFYVLSTTNLASTLDQWRRLATNRFDVSGNFIFTNSLVPAAPQQFYCLQFQ